MLDRMTNDKNKDFVPHYGRKFNNYFICYNFINMIIKTFYSLLADDEPPFCVFLESGFKSSPVFRRMNVGLRQLIRALR